MTRLRLLVLSSDPYPPTRVDVSVLFGVELAQRGHQIDWILQSEAVCARPYVAQWGGGKVWVGATDLGQSLLRRVRKHLLGLANDCRLFSVLRHARYDAVEVKDKFLAGILAIIARRIFRVRFIYWLSFPFPEYYLLRAKDGTARYPFLYTLRGSVFRYLLYRCLLPAADHVFVQSEQMRRDIAAAGVPIEKMTAVPMGIQVQMFPPADPREARRVLPAGVPCVLYLGTLDRMRRLEFLIQAFAIARGAVPLARLYVVGQGEDPQDLKFLEQEVTRLELGSSVVFVGRLPQAEALRYVQEADVCASPLYPTPVLRVGSPTKLFEYMAMAKAVVVNDHPEQKQVIEDSGAGYCVAYEVRPFAEAMVSLLQNPELAQAMGQRGRRWALEHRAYGVIADRVEKSLLGVLEGKS
jgi:glycosyltransferase involved in cell wall biosynthesis